jgi:hypothetical protein
MQKNSPVHKLLSSLKRLKKLVSEVDLNGQVYREGTTVGQIAFHASQTANFWLKVRLLGGEFERDKDSEMTVAHGLEEILESVDSAILACQELGEKELDLNEKLTEVVEMSDYELDSVGSALIFLSAHTGEHVAEITMYRDYVSTLK